MGTHGVAPEEVPVLGSVDDGSDLAAQRRAEIAACTEGRRPYIAVEATDHGLTAIYDMTPTESMLTEAACAEVHGALHDDLGPLDGSDPDEEIVAVIGPVEGKIFPLPERTARELLAGISTILFHPAHWTEAR